MLSKSLTLSPSSFSILPSLSMNWISIPSTMPSTTLPTSGNGIKLAASFTASNPFDTLTGALSIIFLSV